jgi:ribosomal-protein-alanine N-acetyltransferase
MSLTRPGTAADLPEIEAIQAASPEAAQWRVEEYLGFDFRVCLLDGRIAGFAVSRVTAPGERELLNLVVGTGFRRRGVGAQLVRQLLTEAGISVFLEVRESNCGARLFYKALGFQEVGLRPTYYQNPPETAIVMMFHSC